MHSLYVYQFSAKLSGFFFLKLVRIDLADDFAYFYVFELLRSMLRVNFQMFNFFEIICWALSIVVELLNNVNLQNMIHNFI